MIHKSSIEDVVKNFLCKLYGTKTLKTPLIIELSPIFRAYDISGKIDYIYRGIQVIVKVVHLDKNELSKLVEFDLLVNPNYTE